MPNSTWKYNCSSAFLEPLSQTLEKWLLCSKHQITIRVGPKMHVTTLHQTSVLKAAETFAAFPKKLPRKVFQLPLRSHRLWVEIACVTSQEHLETPNRLFSLCLCSPAFLVILVYLFCTSAQWGLFFSIPVCPSPVYPLCGWAEIIELMAKLHLFRLCFLLCYTWICPPLFSIYINWFLSSSDGSQLWTVCLTVPFFPKLWSSGHAVKANQFLSYSFLSFVSLDFNDRVIIAADLIRVWCGDGDWVILVRLQFQ